MKYIHENVKIFFENDGGTMYSQFRNKTFTSGVWLEVRWHTGNQTSRIYNSVGLNTIL